MKKSLFNVSYKIIASFILVSICLLYLYFAPVSSSWLHKEDKLEGDYKIGQIMFWLNSVENHSINIDIAATAPTRFFHGGVDRDENFDMVVMVYEIKGKNLGDIDVNVGLTCTDTNSSVNSMFYVFVPSNTTDTNFLNHNYRDYLDSLFSSYSLTTPLACKTAMNSINTAQLDLITDFKVEKDLEKTIAYLLVWLEYDNINFGTPSAYVSVSYPITIKANAHQDYYPS